MRRCGRATSNCALPSMPATSARGGMISPQACSTSVRVPAPNGASTGKTVSLAELIARVHPDDVAHLQQQLAVVRATAANKSRHLIEHRVVHPDGAVRWLSIQASVNFEGEGPARRAVLVIGTSQDITDRKDAEQRQQRHEAELAHVARIATMGEMAASLAHELNQPLQAVITYADGSIMRLAKQPDKDEQLVSTLEQISHEAKRAGQIIRRIRGFVEKRQPQVSEVLVNELVDDCIRLNHGELERRRIHVVMELGHDLPPLRGDPVQIEQVILNLVRNAMESMDETPDDSRTLERQDLARRRVLPSRSTCAITARELATNLWKNSSSPSSRRSPKGWGWAWPSADRSCRHTRGDYGHPSTGRVAALFTSPCPPPGRIRPWLAELPYLLWTTISAPAGPWAGSSSRRICR